MRQTQRVEHPVAAADVSDSYHRIIAGSSFIPAFPNSPPPHSISSPLLHSIPPRVLYLFLSLSLFPSIPLPTSLELLPSWPFPLLTNVTQNPNAANQTHTVNRSHRNAGCIYSREQQCPVVVPGMNAIASAASSSPGPAQWTFGHK